MGTEPSKKEFEEAAADLEATASLFGPYIEKLTAVVAHLDTQERESRQGGVWHAVPREIDVSIDDIYSVHQTGERTFFRYLHLYPNATSEWISGTRQQFGMTMAQGLRNVLHEKQTILLKYAALCWRRSDRPISHPKTPTFVHHHYGETKFMRDEYKDITGIAVGPNATVKAKKIDLKVWKVEAEKLDLSKLADSLSALRSQLRTEDPNDEHEDERLHVSAAEKAAKKGDGEKTLEHLKQAGKWVLEIASKIGESVAVKAITTALGLPGAE